MLYADYDYTVECEYKPLYYTQETVSYSDIYNVNDINSSLVEITYTSVPKIYKYASSKPDAFVYLIDKENNSDLGFHIINSEKVLLVKRISSNLYKMIVKL